MAKKKESSLKNWEEIDSSLKKLGELQIQKTNLDNELTEKVNELKLKYTSQSSLIQTEIKQIEKEISRFCEQNKDTFLNKRNKKLNFGLISYRLSEKVVCSSIGAAIKALKQLNYDWCIRTKEELDKDEVKKLDSNILTRIGVQIVKEDKLTIEPNTVKIAATMIN
ncbi:host-nuclease inhibitor Gam family protein [bacterium]|nr:host-nuclease inhibitor Gam family protein [bacterium]